MGLPALDLFQIKNAVISASSSGDNALVSAVSGKQIIVLQCALISNGTVKGFGIQSSYNSSNYAVCSGSVTMKVTYTE